MIRKLAPLAAAIALIAAPTAFAQSKGDFTVGIGVHNVAPKSNNGTLPTVLGNVDIETGDSVRPTITGEYFIADNIGIELIAALPFQHDVNVKGVGKVGSVKHLPPTLSVQYHFGAPDATVKPFVGAGVNYTWFYDEKTQGVLNGVEMKIDNSWGAALHAGIDFKVGNGAIRIDARKIDIDADVRLNEGAVGGGTVNIDPIVYGAAYVMKF